MSVFVEPPLFTQQTSSPSFSGQSQSSDDLLHAPAPMPTPASASLPVPVAEAAVSPLLAAMPPAAQRHDREDAYMQDQEESAGHRQQQEATNSNSNNHNPDAVPSTIAVEIAAMDADAMDTTPDIDTHPVASDGPVGAQADLPLAPNSAAQRNGPALGQAVPEAASPAAVVMDTAQIDGLARPDTTMPAVAVLQPPPPPPPIDIVPSESDSSDDDDGVPPWHPIQEDTSSPNEEELKEITKSMEYSALDHEYWESKAFLPLEEPEYSAGATGRIHWSINAYNGTRENPNRDVVMKSEPVTIGGHQWQIKFYPKGNDSDYLSIYLECLSVMDAKATATEEQPDASSASRSEQDAGQNIVQVKKEKDTGLVQMGADRATADITDQASSYEIQHTPLPLFGTKTMPKRKCVAAQVSVVLYNPTEPRVHYSRTALHCFCNGSPDWGWTRFCGPHYDIAHRMRGQRQALLRDDKLALTGYVRVVNDETGCLWEHHSRENPWDSFAMTGLQGLMLGEDASAPGGNMISAVASWMLFRPFRDLLYDLKLPDPESLPFSHPKPLLCALQKVLYMLRTRVEPGAGAVGLDDISDALEWYGIHDRLDKLDVVETWEVLRTKLSEELRGTIHASTLETLFGPTRDIGIGGSSFRVPVVGVESVQNAVNKTPSLSASTATLPQLLTIELARQVFDLKSRSYIKLQNKVKLDEQLTINGTSFTLYGIVVHKQTLQSYVYQPILRPEGSGSKWYSYSDSKDENQVRCLAKRQAIDVHEGKPGEGQVIGNDAIAYVVMYVRDDVGPSVFSTNAGYENWDIPEWMVAEVERRQIPDELHTMPSLPLGSLGSPDEDKQNILVEAKPAEAVEVQVVNSRIFLQHEGPGLFNLYDDKRLEEASELIHTIHLHDKDDGQQIREKIASVITGIQDLRQIKFWFMDTVQGSYGRPDLLGTGKVEFSCGEHSSVVDKKVWTYGQFQPALRCIWVHITDFEQLPKLPEEKQEHELVAVEESSNSTPEGDSHAEAGTIPTADHRIQPEMDTLMSDLDEATAVPQTQQLESSTGQPAISSETNIEQHQEETTISPTTTHPTDTNAGNPPDTEMSDTVDALQMPPPPPSIPLSELLQPPPPARTPSSEPPTEDIYFFLKFWDPSTQTLKARGSYIVSRSSRVDETIASLLELPIEDKKKLEMWEEDELTVTRVLRHRRTFAQLDLRNTTIITVGYPHSIDQRGSLAEHATPADLQAYLSYCAFARNFPHKVNGHFTYDYFSSEYYKGEVKNGQQHGHGKYFYHSGATYDGAFRMGQRHGHGLYTFQNGDTYDGDWVDNQQHGSGTFLEAATGNTYVGGWKNDRKFGEGVTHWKNAQEAERMCRICWDEPAEAAFYDCGHVVACLTCAREVQTCPVCRKRVLSAMKLYYVA
ncbi:hypothetical protein ACN47E_008083 [Coniothyrium glycines]